MPDIFDTIELPKTNTFSGQSKKDIFDEISLEEPINQPEPKSDNLLNKPIETLAKSGGEYVGNIFSAIGHPIKTIQSIGTIIKGGIEKLKPGEQIDEKAFDSVVKFYTDRYGNAENLKKTVLEDPVGFMGDLSTVLGVGGGIANKAGQVSKVGNLAKTGQVLSKASRITDPVTSTLNIAGTAIKGATAGRKIAPFASKLDKPVIEAAKEVGVDLPASAKSTSRVVPITEVAVGKGLFGGEIIKKIETAHTQLNNYADNIISKTAQAPDLTSAGQAIFKGADIYRNNFIRIKNELYNKALLPTGKTQQIIKVSPLKSKKFIDTILQDKEFAEGILGKAPGTHGMVHSVTTDIGYFRNLSKNLSAKYVDGRFLKAAVKELNNKINNFNDPIATGNKGTLKKLVTLMSEDLDNAIVTQRPDLADAIGKANQFYSEGIQKLNSAYGEKIFQLAKDGQYDKILPAIINKSTSIEDVPKIYEVIGKENAPALQSAFLEDFFKKSKNPNGNFTPYGITQQIKSLGGETKLQAILTPEQFKAVKNLEQVSRGLGKAEKIAGGSQTAFIGRMMFELGATFTNPVTALKVILTDAGFSKFITSKYGQDFLTEGFALSGKTGEKIVGSANKIGRIGSGLRLGGIVQKENY